MSDNLEVLSIPDLVELAGSGDYDVNVGAQDARDLLVSGDPFNATVHLLDTPFRPSRDSKGKLAVP